MCEVPSNALTNDSYSTLSSVIGDWYSPGDVLVDSCGTSCSPDTPSECQSSYVRAEYRCRTNNNGISYWVQNGKGNRNVFFSGDTPRRFGKKHLCKPLFSIPEIDRLEVCGAAPKISLKKWASQGTRYDDNLTTILCPADSLPAKLVLSMSCHYQPGWLKAKWVHQNSSGKKRPLKATLASKCKYRQCNIYVQLSRSLSRMQKTHELGWMMSQW